MGVALKRAPRGRFLNSAHLVHAFLSSTQVCKFGGACNMALHLHYIPTLEHELCYHYSSQFPELRALWFQCLCFLLRVCPLSREYIESVGALGNVL